ncbi:hypothetical protein ACI2R5_004931, partial [Escherichia coli]
NITRQKDDINPDNKNVFTLLPSCFLRRRLPWCFIAKNTNFTIFMTKQQPFNGTKPHQTPDNLG